MYKKRFPTSGSNRLGHNELGSKDGWVKCVMSFKNMIKPYFASMAVWSGVNIAGVSLAEVSRRAGSREGQESWQTELHKKVISSAYEIIKLKGYTSWAIGLSVARIVSGIMSNSRNVFALSTNVNGLHGITDDVYLSLPCVVGTNGVTHVIKQNLNEEEVDKLHKSWKTLFDVQKELKL
ncbi:lactate/malate dehydrogenase, alpha/beta protein [Cooperia oncophora]